MLKLFFYPDCCGIRRHLLDGEKITKKELDTVRIMNNGLRNLMFLTEKQHQANKEFLEKEKWKWTGPYQDKDGPFYLYSYLNAPEKEPTE